MEHVFEYLVYSFYLAFGLRVKSGAEGYSCSRSFVKLLSEPQGKLSTWVRHNLFRNSVEAHDPVDVEVG